MASTSAPKSTAAAPKEGGVKPKLNFRPLPEALIKKRKVQEKNMLKLQRQRRSTAIKRKASKKVAFTKAATYAKEYKKAEALLIRKRRQARNAGNLFAEPEPKVAFVFRLRGILGVSPKPRKVLQLLRLRQLNTGVFIRLNKATKNMLRLCEPYIAYGYPNLKTIRQLIYKRGFARVSRARVPLTDNAIIEESLGKHGIICMEDLVHEIYTAGPNFSHVSRFLWPFRLNSPKGGFRDKGRHYCEGGDAGDREDLINELLRRMV